MSGLIIIAAAHVLALLLAAGFIWARRGFRMRLRWLLFGVACVCGAIVLARSLAWPPVAHRLAISQIHAVAGTLYYAEDVDRFKPSPPATADDDPWRDVGHVGFDNDAQVAGAAAQLQWLPELESITLGGGVTDAGLQLLAKHGDKLPMRTVALNETPITDAGLAAFEELSGIEEVYLQSNPSMGDEALRHLANAPSLEKIRILEQGPLANRRRFTAAGFHSLAESKTLESLHLINLDIPDDAANQLAQLRQLKELDLKFCGISDEAVQTLYDGLSFRVVSVFGAADGVIRVRPRGAPRTLNVPPPGQDQPGTADANLWRIE